MSDLRLAQRWTTAGAVAFLVNRQRRRATRQESACALVARIVVAGVEALPSFGELGLVH